jgi:hypothetical protein
MNFISFHAYVLDLITYVFNCMYHKKEKYSLFLGSILMLKQK